jgi:hypothetical protein
MREVIAGFLVSLVVVGAAGCLVFAGIARPWPLVAILLAALVLPLSVPNGRWLLGCAVFFLIGAVGLTAQHLYVVSNAPHRGGGAGEVIGIAFFAFVLVAFMLGATIKGAILAVKARRRAREYDGATSDKLLERTHGR